MLVPAVDGWTLLKEFRRQRQTLPIIIITAGKDDRKLRSPLSKGANYHITKPLRFSDLLERIQTHLSRG